MQGRRLNCHEPGCIPCEEPGDYGQDVDGNWWAKVPRPGFPTGILSDHQVTEHENGTITVSPSILMDVPGKGYRWHGYLERGEWRELSDSVYGRSAEEDTRRG